MNEKSESFVVRSAAREMTKKFREHPDDIHSYKFIGAYTEGDFDMDRDYKVLKKMSGAGKTFLYRVVPEPDGMFAGLDGHYECWARVESESLKNLLY